MIQGIDVASYQATDFSTSGLDFAFIKATESTSYVNPKMTAQAATARKAGLVVGFYHFLHPGNIQAQAQYFVDKADSVDGDVLFLDWEQTGSGRATSAEKDEFLVAVKKLRPTHRVGLYCNTDFWLHVDTSSNAGDALWIADPNHPEGKPGITHPWLFDQYSSAGGTDRNVANFPSRAALQTWARADIPVSKPAPTPAPAPKPTPAPAPAPKPVATPIPAPITPAGQFWAYRNGQSVEAYGMLVSLWQDVAAIKADIAAIKSKLGA